MGVNHLPATEAEITERLVMQIAIIRKREPATVDPTRPFNELGIDSLDAMALVGDIEDSFAVVVDPAELFDYPTPGDLARMIAARSVRHDS
jgi:acyl carrier protein